ncbi:hypothetical protein IU510_30550 [Nocardia cyriacigeorgica]|uniref:hypothetical protein n=1 Tax=Nocardia cyriacigeorgica TaxID=135487 RepID=UPI0018934A4A|nr:hypothetical protein [Nocardia cyriacigeorgica]MBF6102362.1 hypothetical protein [Nocardia cyriacigeorgica]MBF6163130.1 hypothetical protein [Nocardia cyriacigeorgica]MBF6202093.1 hypothetical protein [Nocardia cyriacigeorgica]MBF6518582.1 hypothetical protein [Nocardia cyriacigeorgica]
MNDLWRREFDALTPLLGQLEDMATKLAAAKAALQQQDNDNSAAVTETATAHRFTRQTAARALRKLPTDT